MKRTGFRTRAVPLRAVPFPRTAGPEKPQGAVQLRRAAVAKGKSAATGEAGNGSGRRESFPPAVAALIDARDPWCVHCGSPRDLQRHHRRIKGIGGDPRPHTDCACNGVRICPACHDWAHSGKGRSEAGDEGLIVPRGTTEPYQVSVSVHLEDDRRGMRKWPLCDGTYADEQPIAGAA